MKKILIVLAMLGILTVTGCGKKEEVKNEVLPNEVVEQKNNESLATLSYDEDGNPYVKLSDSYYYEDYKEMKEITPAKIYLVEGEEYNININVPIEKCETEDEERIVYSKYGIERMLKTGKVLVGGIEIDPFYHEDDEDYSYKNDMLYWFENGELPIHEVELDNDESTKELLVVVDKGYPDDLSSYLVKYEGGVATIIGEAEGVSFKQIGKYKNMFTDGENLDVEFHLPNVLMGYYVYDKNEGLIHVEKMANGDNISDLKVEKLGKGVLRFDEEFGAVDEEDYKEYCDGVKYATWAIADNDDIVTLKQGTEIKIIKIVDEYGNFIGETEDGTRYAFVNYAGRT